MLQNIKNDPGRGQFNCSIFLATALGKRAKQFSAVGNGFSSEENSFLRLKIELGSAPNGFLASKMNFRSKKTVFRG